jgi:hypothetical protein
MLKMAGSEGILSVLIKFSADCAVKGVLTGRRRSREDEKLGRFTGPDVKAVISAAWKSYEELFPAAPAYEGFGARFMMQGGVYSLALYRAMRAFGVDKAYATELCGDVLWKLYEREIKPAALLARLIYRAPQKRLNFVLRTGLKTVMYPPGYQYTFEAGPDCFRLDFTKCPICDFFASQGPEELEFFRKTWCSFDFAVIESMTGGKTSYQRTSTLSDGQGVCDMKWRAWDK